MSWLCPAAKKLTVCPGVYEPFNVVTSNALQHALSELGHTYDERLVVQIMASYNRLQA